MAEAVAEGSGEQRRDAVVALTAVAVVSASDVAVVGDVAAVVID